MNAPHKRLNVVGLMCGFALSTPALAGGSGPVAQPVWPTFQNDQACTPQIVSGTLKLGNQVSAAVTAQMKTILAANQGDRQGEIVWSTIEPRDTARRNEVLGLLTEGKINTGDSLHDSALVFQHGNCSNHFLLANALAKLFMQRGRIDANALFALTMDRYLMSQNKPQKYGTQYLSDIKGCNYYLYKTDPATIDAERIALGVPTLAEAKASADQFNALTCKN